MLALATRPTVPRQHAAPLAATAGSRSNHVNAALLRLVGNASVLFVLSLVAPPRAMAAEKVDAQAYQQCVDRAIEFLRTKGQEPDGSFAGYAGPGVTAVVTAGILRAGRTADDPWVAKSLKYLEGFVQPDGGIYKPGTLYQNYETCLAMVCFAEANKKKQYDKLLAAADRFVKKLQWDQDEGHERGQLQLRRRRLRKTQAAGPVQHELPDGRAAARRATDRTTRRSKKALTFVSRCQNLESEFNTTKFSAKNPDGGFYYTPAAGGESMAGKTPDGGLRSYGSMTYAGLKSMIYAGVGPDDPRVKAALTWIRKHYAVDENPGMGDAGPVLLLPHLRQGAGRDRPRRDRGRARRQARLAARSAGRAGQTPEARRLVGQRQPPLARERTRAWSPATPCWR